MAFSFPPIRGVTTDVRRVGTCETASTLLVTEVPLKLLTGIGPVKAEAHAAPPISTAIVRAICTMFNETNWG